MFGFNDNRPALNLNLYLANIIKFFILTLIALFIHNWVQKTYAHKVGASTELSIWASNRGLTFSKKKVYLPWGGIIPILVSIFSQGQLFFAAPTSTNIKVNPGYRIGREYIRLTEFEYAKIAAVAPLIHILLAIIFSFSQIPLLKDFVLVNTMMALSFMLPLPNLLGLQILFGSKPLYVFSTAFILTATLLLNILSSFYTILTAIILATFVFIAYLWQFYKK